ncbi:MAG: hypothetical protein WD081_10360 [Gammaproteobacteria bacterium]
MVRYLGIALALLMLSGCGATTGARAPATAPAAPEKIESIEGFLAHQDYIRAGLQDGSLGDVTERQLEMVIEKQDKLREILSTVDSIDALDEIETIEVLNAQETINGILARNLEDRPICRRETVLGSHRTRTVCMTANQREKLREDSRSSLRYLQRAIMPEGG